MAEKASVELNIEVNTEKAKAGIVELQKNITQVKAEAEKPANPTFFNGMIQGAKEFGKQAEDAGKGFVASLGPIAFIAGAIMAIVSKIKELTGVNQKASQSFEKIGEIIDTIVRPPLEVIISGLAKVAEGVAWLVNKISKGAVEAAAEQNKLNDAVQRTGIASSNAADEYAASMQKIQALAAAGLATEEETKQARSAAASEYLQYLEQQYAAQVKLNGAASVDSMAIANKIKALREQVASTTKTAEIQKASIKEVKKLTDLENLAIEIAKSEAAYREVEARAQLDVAQGTVTQEEAEERISKALTEHNKNLSSLDQKYRNVVGSADLIAASMKEAVEQEEKITELEQLSAEIKKAEAEYRQQEARAQINVIQGMLKAETAQMLITDAALAHNRALEILDYRFRDVAGSADLIAASLKDITIEQHEATKLETLTEKILKSEAAYREVEARAQLDLNKGLINQQQAEERILAAANKHNETLGKLDNGYKGISGAADLIADSWKEINKQAEELTELEKLSLELTSLEKIYREKEAQAQLDLNAGLINQQQAEERILAAANKHNEQVQEMAGRYAGVEGATDKLAASLKKVKGEADTTIESFDTLEIAAAAVGTANDIANASADLAGNIINKKLEAQKETVEKALEAMRQTIDKFYEEENARIEEERNHALEAAGFVAATSQEGLEASMQAALDSMDADIIYAEQRRQQELAINKKFDEQQLALQKETDAQKEQAEKDAANKIADIEYEQAMAAWTMQLLLIPGQIAAAIMQGLAQVGPFGAPAGAIIAATIGALQLASLLAAKPQKPKAFALGGTFEGSIVDKPTRFKFAQGGTIQDGIMAEAGTEAIMPLARMADGALGVNASGSDGGGEVRAVSLSDLSKYMVKLINEGHADVISASRVR